METINWAIVAPGRIATKFATALIQQKGHRLAAICSRSLENANHFATAFDPAAKRFDDLSQCLAENSIDVVYIANPHPFHFEAVHLALRAGKAVLCEKPMTMKADQTRELVELARKQQIFLMEAIWMRFMPALIDVKQRVQAGQIGDVLFLSAQLTLKRAVDPDHRLFSPGLGGGAMLDLGIYPLAFADMMLGEPIAVQGLRHNAHTGVDDVFTFTAGYSSGAVAQLLCSTRFEIDNSAKIIGTQGQIDIIGPFHQADQIIINAYDGMPQTLQFPHDVNGYEWEIREVARALRAGKTESPLMPLATSVGPAEQMDGLLAALPHR